MKIVKSDHKQLSQNSNDQKLVERVRSAIQMALDESNWSKQKTNKQPKVRISENQKVQGDSGMLWPVDLAIHDGSAKRRGAQYAIIQCIDFDDVTSISKKAPLDRSAAYFQDLDLCQCALFLVCVNSKARSRGQPLVPSGFNRVLGNHDVRIVEWNPGSTLEFIAQLLNELWNRHDGPVRGISSVRITVQRLTKKYPKIFKDRRQMPKKTRCVEILQQIKEDDPHATYGEIIRNTLLQEKISYPLIFNFLGKIDDRKFEELLIEYLERQREG